MKSEKHSVYTEGINKIALSSNDDKILQTFDNITTYPYGTNAFKVCESEMLSKYKWSILKIKQMKVKQKAIWNGSFPYRKLIIGGSGSRKTNALLNLKNNQPYIDKICLYAKDPYEAQYKFLINKRESTGSKHFNDTKAFIEYSNDIQDVYKAVGEDNIDKKRKILIVFDDMIADMINNKKVNSVVTDLFRGRKLDISLIFITQAFF